MRFECRTGYDSPSGHCESEKAYASGSESRAYLYVVSRRRIANFQGHKRNEDQMPSLSGDSLRHLVLCKFISQSCTLDMSKESLEGENARVIGGSEARLRLITSHRHGGVDRC